MKLTYEIIITIVLFLCIYFVYKGQQRITLNNGQGYDGVYYYAIAEQIQHDTNPIVGELPFIKRVGTCFLVGTYSKISGINLLDSALFINLIGTFISVLLLMFWLRIFIDIFWIRQILLFLFMMAWHAKLRFSFFIPMAIDAWGSVWFVSGLLLLHCIRKSYNNNKGIFLYVLAFSFVVAVGNLFREFNAVLAIALFFLFNPLKGLNISLKTMAISHGVKIIKQIWSMYFIKRSLILFLPIIVIVLINVIVSNFIVISHQNDYSYFKTVFMCFYKKSLPEYLLGIFNAYGPLILLLPFFYRQFKSLFLERQELLVPLIISLFFGFIGGSDTERIFFQSGFPIFFVLIGLSIKSIFSSAQRWWLYVLFVLQTIAYRFYWTIPDYPSEIKHIPIPFFTLMSNQFQNSYLTSYYGHYLLNSILFIEYLLLFLATFYVLHNKIIFKYFKLFSWNKLSDKN